MVELLDISISRVKPKAMQSPAKREWRTIRVLPDGQCEQVGYRNRRRRTFLTKCLECEESKPEIDFECSGQKDGICKDCWLSAQRQKTSWGRRVLNEERNKFYAGVLVSSNEYSSAERRMAILRLASPDWRDRKAIAGIYLEAKRLAHETGKPHDVDHFYPLQSHLCCGLHVSANLRIMKASENRSKNNAFPLDQSPAWEGSTPDDIAEFIRSSMAGLTK